MCGDWQDEMQMLEEIIRREEEEKMMPVPVARDEAKEEEEEDDFPLLEWQPDGELKITPRQKKHRREVPSADGAVPGAIGAGDSAANETGGGDKERQR